MGFPYDKGTQGIKEIPNVAPGSKQSMVAQRPVRKLSKEEIKKSVEAFGLSAGRAKTAGFDALYIHAVGGYLTAQFMSPYFNDRDDEYGGSLENRMRFLLEQIEASKKQVGDDFPIIVRMSIDEFLGDAGRGVEESKKIGKMLEEAGVSAIDCSAAIFETMHMLIPPVYVPEGALVPLAEAMKSVVNIPVITQGRLHDPDLAESVLADNKADFVILARSLIADPDWVKKVAEGDSKAIRHCISCNYCVGKRVLGNLPLRCTVNQEAGRESENLNPKAATRDKKNITIIGGGPAGLEAAYVLGSKGHNVDVYEASDRLCGGQLATAWLTPDKSILKSIPDFYEEQLSRLANVNIYLNTPVKEEDIDNIEADIVFLATGGKPLIPDIPGIKGKNVYTAEEVLKEDIKLSGSVVVAGGGQTGCGAAYYLLDKGYEVSLIEMLPGIALKDELISMLSIRNILQARCSQILTNTCIDQITESGLDATNTETGEKIHISSDNVVIAFGAVSENKLYDKLTEKFPVVSIGDSDHVGDIQSAIENAFFAALEV